MFRPREECLGSSTTAGKSQAFDWIGELAGRPQNRTIQFKNFGVGGDLAYHGLQRLPRILACNPSKVVVLLGSNDVIALISPTARRWRRWSFLRSLMLRIDTRMRGQSRAASCESLRRRGPLFSWRESPRVEIGCDRRSTALRIR